MASFAKITGALFRRHISADTNVQTSTVVTIPDELIVQAAQMANASADSNHKNHDLDWRDLLRDGANSVDQMAVNLEYLVRKLKTDSPDDQNVPQVNPSPRL